MAVTEALVPRDPISTKSPHPPVLFEAKLDGVRLAGEALDRPRLTGALPQTKAALVLVAAPPGFGKTTLLAQWRDGDDRGFASVSLDSADNDPTLLWRYVVAAIRRVEPGFGEPALAALRCTDVDVLREVVPAVLGELGSVGVEIVLALDDYQEIQSRACHDSVAFFVERLPANVTLAVSTRADPPIPIGRLRGLGRLLELRAADLCFTEGEHEAFLNETLQLGLSERSLAVLHERTEGWPVGVCLAALSLRGVDDRGGFVDRFGGASRHVVDYLTEVVLDTLDEELGQFLLETSLLEWLSGPLCDAACGREGSAELLARLERANLFLLPLDDRRERYRYHQLFGDVLRSQLLRTDPGRAREVRRCASAWLADAGRTSEAISHAVAAGEPETAAGLVLADWRPSFDSGEAETGLHRLEALPPGAIERDARLALVEAWSATVLNRRDEALEAIEAAESAVLDGMLPDGSSLEAGFALVRACFPGGDVGGMLTAALRASELEGDRSSAWQPVVLLALGRAEYLAGRPELARPPLERADALAARSGHWLVAARGKSLLAWISLAADDVDGAEDLAREAVEIIEAKAPADQPGSGVANVALGAVLARRGDLEEADRLFERGLASLRAQGEVLDVLDGLLAAAPVRRALGAADEARAMLAEARTLVGRCADSGMLRGRLEEVARRLTPAHRRVDGDSELTERELEVLRYLAEGLSKREVGEELYLSFNTIHSHTKSIYQKLRVSSRDAAVDRAREQGVL